MRLAFQHRSIAFRLIAAVLAVELASAILVVLCLSGMSATPTFVPST
jgi:hypothetical protein